MFVLYRVACSAVLFFWECARPPRSRTYWPLLKRGLFVMHLTVHGQVDTKGVEMLRSSPRCRPAANGFLTKTVERSSSIRSQVLPRTSCVTTACSGFIDRSSFERPARLPLRSAVRESIFWVSLSFFADFFRVKRYAPRACWLCSFYVKLSRPRSLPPCFFRIGEPR